MRHAEFRIFWHHSHAPPPVTLPSSRDGPSPKNYFTLGSIPPLINVIFQPKVREVKRRVKYDVTLQWHNPPVFVTLVQTPPPTIAWRILWTTPFHQNSSAKKARYVDKRFRGLKLKQTKFTIYPNWMLIDVLTVSEIWLVSNVVGVWSSPSAVKQTAIFGWMWHTMV